MKKEICSCLAERRGFGPTEISIPVSDPSCRSGQEETRATRHLHPGVEDKDNQMIE